MIAMEKTFGTGSFTGTHGAYSASIVRVNLDDFNSIQPSLVFNESLQLIEAPGVEPEVESLAFPCVPYSSKVFHDDCISSIAAGYYCFADVVVNPSLEALLPARDFFKQPFGRPCAFGLKFGSQMLEIEHSIFDFVSREELFFGCDSNMVYPKVYADDFIAGIRINNIVASSECNVYEHFILLVNGERSSLIFPVKVLPVIFWDFNWNVYSSIESCEPDFIEAESKCSFVEVNWHVFLESWHGPFICFNGLEGLGSNSYGIDDELTFKVEFFFSTIVNEMMQFVPVRDVVFESNISDVRNAFGIFFHGIEQDFVAWNFQLYCNNRLEMSHNSLQGFFPYKPCGHLSCLSFVQCKSSFNLSFSARASGCSEDFQDLCNSSENIGIFASDNMLRRAAIHLSFKNAEFPCFTKL